MALIVVAAILLVFSFAREWLFVKQTGWDRLSQRYRCAVPFTGRYKGCWWAQFTVARRNFNTVTNVGRMTRWPIRFEVPPYWIVAASEGLYLKRNVWNVLHPALLIPWKEIQSANEVTYKDLARSSPTAALAIAAAQGASTKLLELKLSDPNLSIVAQLVAFEEARRFLGGKLRLLNSQNI